MVLEGPGEDSPLLFIEKDIITVTINDVYMEGSGAVPYTYCEVYAPLDISTHVWCPRLTLALPITLTAAA